jgi:hypothetical protein
VFVDGHAISEAGKCHSLKLSPGNHKVELVNYGYTPQVRDVVITAGETTDLEASLISASSSVSGPFGAITSEGASRKAVLLNGKTPDFFVGHGDEFNHEWGWKQELVVPPGNYELTLLKGDTVSWFAPVTVNANERAVVRYPNGVSKTVPWPRGEKLTSIPRFTAGTASASVAVARPTAQLSAGATTIYCGDSSQIKWTTTDAPQVEVAPIGQVTPSGEQSIRPTQTTNYQLTAVGPGGEITSDTTVNVNTEVQAHLELSPAQVQYKQIDDKVLEEGSTSLNWTSTNASAVSIAVGTVAPSGSQAIQGKPKKTDSGPIDETVTYTLSAKNECGGTTTQTATLHIVGSIAPPELVMRSVYFQKDVLLSGHADERGSTEYNQALSERRTELVKQFLIDQGVSADHLQAQAFGEKQNLSADEVKELFKQNPNITEEERDRENVEIRDTGTGKQSSG